MAIIEEENETINKFEANFNYKGLEVCQETKKNCFIFTPKKITESQIHLLH